VRRDGTVLRIAELPGPKGLPVIGNAHKLDLSRFHLQLEAWRREHGDLYRLKVWSREFVVFAEPQVIAEALRDRPATFGRTQGLVEVAQEMRFGGVFASNGEKWRRHRPMVMAAFDPGHVKRYFPALVQVAQRLARRWQRAAQAGEAIPLQHDLMLYTLDVIAGLAFGTDINTLENADHEIQQHLDHVFPAAMKRVLSPFPYWRHFKLPADRALDRHLAAVRESVDGFIAAARERLRLDAELRAHPANLIEAMIVARERPGSELTDEDVAANVATMLLAGEDTTAHTLCWMAWLLASHPGALRRATAEVRSVLGEERVPTRLEQIDALAFLDACAHETMRLKPVGPMLAQQTARDTVLGGVAIPQGTRCIFLMRAGATDARHFQAPERFAPERWLGELEGAKADNVSGKRISMPFGAGPRMCPGRYLALTEVKMAMATLLASFDLLSVAAADGGKVEERLAFTMSPTPLAMRLRPRALPGDADKDPR
jgi:cytochrome P450